MVAAVPSLPSSLTVMVPVRIIANIFHKWARWFSRMVRTLSVMSALWGHRADSAIPFAAADFKLRHYPPLCGFDVRRIRP